MRAIEGANASHLVCASSDQQVSQDRMFESSAITRRMGLRREAGSSMVPVGPWRRRIPSEMSRGAVVRPREVPVDINLISTSSPSFSTA